MATISELNVRLGLLYKDFDKSLSTVEKRLERSSRQFSQLGNDLTLAITAPLAALGVSAIQQAGEIESLKLAMTSTFESAGRSAAEATAEVEALRQAAKAPGIDFEQAVRGSVRLQGVGFSAEEARATLVELANAISLTGGTAFELDAVTRQFAQMTAKGRVLQEDVTILSENMPRIADLMQKAFGTASVEAIREMGVTGKEFVQRLTEAAAALPRVEGGIKNALVNAGAEARNSLAKLGEAINKAFDIPKTLDGLTEKLAAAVEWFDSLDDSTKRTIVQTGALAIAAGPLVKVYGALAGGVGQLVGVFGSLASATKPVALFLAGMTESTKSVTGYVKDFSKTMLGAGEAAMKMRVGVLAATGGLAAIIIGIAAAVTLLADNFNAAEFATEQFAKAQQDVTKEAANEVGQLNKNIDVLRDVRSTTDQRKAAIDDLLKTYPGYLKGVDLEKASLERLNAIQKDLTANIIRGIAERKKADAVNSIYEKQAEILLRIQRIQREGKADAGEIAAATRAGTIGGGFVFQAEAAQGVIKNLQNQVADLGKQANVTAADFDKAFGLATRTIDPLLEQQYRARAAADDARDAFLGFGEAAKKTGESATKTSTIAADKAQKMADVYENVKKSIDAVNKKQAELGADFVPEKTREIEAGVEKLIEAGYGPSSKPVQELKKRLADIRAEIAKGFQTANATQIAVQDISQVTGALATLQKAQEDAGTRKKAIEELTAAYPEYLRGIDLEKASLGELDRIQQDLTKTILEASQVRGGADMSTAVDIAANIDVSGAVSELKKLYDVPEITARVDVSGALAELEKLSLSPEIAATADVSGALNELKKIADIPDVSAIASIDVSGALAELQKLSRPANILAQVDISGALSDLEKLTDIPEITARVDVSGALAELKKLEQAPEIAATADVSAALRELSKLSEIPDISAVASVDVSAALAELAKLENIPVVVDTAAALTQVEQLTAAIEVLKSADSGGDIRAAAIADLVSKYPEYLKNIDLEKAGIQELTALQQQLTAATAQAQPGGGIIPQVDATEAVAQVESLKAALDALRQTTGGEDNRVAAIKALTDAYPEYLKNIDIEKASTAELIALQATLTAAIQQTAQQRAAAGTGAAPASVPTISTLATATSVQSFEVSGAEQAIAQAKAFAQSVAGVSESFVGLQNQSLSTGEQIAGIWAQMEAGGLSFGQAIMNIAAAVQDGWLETFKQVSNAAFQFAGALIQAEAQRAEQEKEQLDVEAAEKIARAKGNADAIAQINADLAAKKAKIDRDVAKKEKALAITQAIINTAIGVTEALGSAAPPVNFILAALTAAAGAVQIATIKSQSFAEGGVVTKPTLGLVGEYPGAQQNPEIISPERKMRQVFREEMGGYGGPTELYSVIKDDHLLLVTERAARRRGRTT